MKNLLKCLIFIVLISSLSSCSLAFLASKNQAVTIEKDSTTKILIDKKEPLIENGKYILPRDGKPKQIDIYKEGYKSESRVILPYKYSGLYFATLGMYTVAGGILANTLAQSLKDDLNEGTAPILIGAGVFFGAGGGALAGFLSPRLMNYDKSINFNAPMLKIIKRDSTMKEVFLNNTSFNVTSDNLKYQYIGFENYINGINKFKTDNNKKNSIKIDNSIFTEKINDILKKNGFIDTSGFVLKGNYRENIFLNATINELKFTRVACNKKKMSNAIVYVEDYFQNFSKIDLKTKWDVLDIYKNVIYSDTLMLKSNEVLDNDSIKDGEYIKILIGNALESGLFTLMNTEKFKKAITLSKTNYVEDLKEIEINKAVKYVTNIEEAVNATVTIKTKSGHGSGFLISENGYLISNYHVIKDSTKLDVVLNNGSIYKAKIIQINKEADLAILKIEEKGLTPFLLSENQTASIGADIYTIGTPSAEDLSQTLTKGIVSSVRNQPNGSKIIQIDASINSGNSGGPLVDKEGKLLGVVNAKLIGIGVEGISFAIPINVVAPSLKLVFK